MLFSHGGTSQHNPPCWSKYTREKQLVLCCDGITAVVFVSCFPLKSDSLKITRHEAVSNYMSFIHVISIFVISAAFHCIGVSLCKFSASFCFKHFHNFSLGTSHFVGDKLLANVEKNAHLPKEQTNEKKAKR